MSIFEELNQIIKSEISKIDAVSVEEQTYKHVPVGDKIIDTFLFGGGLPLGSFITFTGHSSSFKTTMIVNIVSKILNSDPESYYLVFLDSEASMTVERVRSLGIGENQFKIYTSLTVESVNSIVNTLSKIKRENQKLSKVNFIVVWDSIASTPTQAELATDDVNKTVGLKARLLSSIIPRWKNSILVKDGITMIVVNQLREKITLLPFQQGGSNLKNLSSDKNLPGGLAAQYLSDILVEQKVVSKYDDNSPYGIRAYVVELKTIKNKFFPDNVKINLVFNPQLGYMKEFTEFEFLKGTNALKLAGGGYYTFEVGGNIFKFRVKELTEKLKDAKFKRGWEELLNKVVEDVEKQIKSQKLIRQTEEATVENED